MAKTSIKYVGLVWKNINKDGFYLDNSCGGFIIKGKGEISATINPSLSENSVYLQVFVNNDPYKVIEVTKGKKEYIICSDIKEFSLIKVIKITEAQYGGIEISNIKGCTVDFEIENRKQILFIGDSLTCGYNVLCNEEKIFSTKYENALKSYAYIASMDLGMEPVFLAESGNGIISRYVDETCDNPNTDGLMTKSIISMDKYIRHFFSGDFYLFHTLSPKYVIVNLGTNDASYVRNFMSRKASFKFEFTNFIRTLKRLYPRAEICVAYGMMEETLLEIQREVCENLKVQFIQLPKSIENVWDGHPTEKSHETAGHYLASHLRKKVEVK